MIIIFTLFTLILNAVNIRREISIIFNRIVQTILIFSIWEVLISIFNTKEDIVLHGGLLNTREITQTITIFIYSLSILILQLTSFYPKNFWIENNTYSANLLYKNMIKYENQIFNKIEGDSPLRMSSIMRSQISSLHPYFVTGFVEGEGGFSLSPASSQEPCSGEGEKGRGLFWVVRPIFTIGLARKDEYLLEQIKDFFNVGHIYSGKNGSMVKYYVTSLKDIIQVIIPHFEKYPLMGEKKRDYELFKQIVLLMEKGEHKSMLGILKLLALKASLNLGLLEGIKRVLPNIIPANKPELEDTGELDPNWISGFVTAEGCFFIAQYMSELRKAGSSVSLVFSISQHIRDKVLMKKIVDYFDCGLIRENKNILEWVVVRINDINSKVIPFFNKYPLAGVKASDFEGFKEASNLIGKKVDLTKDGSGEFRALKSGMMRSDKGNKRSMSTEVPFKLNNTKEYTSSYPININPSMYNAQHTMTILFTIIGAIFLISANDLVSIFLSIELQSYGLYVLSSIYRNSEWSTAGGLSYFLLGGLSTCFILLGLSLIYVNSGTTLLDGLNIITGLSDISSVWVRPVTDFERNYQIKILYKQPISTYTSSIWFLSRAVAFSIFFILAN